MATLSASDDLYDGTWEGYRYFREVTTQLGGLRFFLGSYDTAGRVTAIFGELGADVTRWDELRWCVMERRERRGLSLQFRNTLKVLLHTSWWYIGKLTRNSPTKMLEIYWGRAKKIFCSWKLLCTFISNFSLPQPFSLALWISTAIIPREN